MRTLQQFTRAELTMFRGVTYRLFAVFFDSRVGRTYNRANLTHRRVRRSQDPPLVMEDLTQPLFTHA